MPSFFIDRPIFAWVIAILITLGGVIAISQLGIEAYPTIAPPQVAVNAVYPGADASTVEKTVTQVIEQQLTGVDHLLYFSSSSSSSGGASITLTFEPGTDPDIAAVQTQNRVSLAQSRLPSEVIQQGITVAKVNPGFLMVGMLKSDDGSMDTYGLNNIVATQVLDQIQRIPGVGNAFQFGSEFAMRIWLNPDKLHGYGLSAVQALAAVRGQNVQVAAGSVGAEPSTAGIGYTATVRAEGRFSTPEEFENILLRANSDGTTVRLKDVARVEIGPGSYGFALKYNDTSTAGFGVQLLTGSNALGVADAVKAKLAELQPGFPKGVSWFIPYDTSTFIHVSIEEVVKTLFEAIVLVFLVMLIFLQNLRITLIPTLVIPVALMGGFLGMWMLGFTINQLSLFGMVLAIGIVVDDAIVVIENVERIMAEEGLSPKDATRKAMGQITGAVIAIAVVLAAVFIPSAMQSGSAGAIYRQFALTIAISMGFSAFLALAFTPALCASMLKPIHETGKKNALFRGFNRLFEWTQNTYTRQVRGAVREAPVWFAVFIVIAVMCGFLFTRLPGSFVPEEDQGYLLAIVQLPPGATIARTNAVMETVRTLGRKNPDVEGVVSVSGFSFVGQGENVGMAFYRLKPWGDRKNNSSALAQQLNGANFMMIKDAQVFVLNLPTIPGLSQFGGFEMYLQDRSGAGHDALIAARNALLGAAGKSPMLAGVRPNGLEDSAQVNMKVDRVQAQSMGVSLSDVYTAIQLMLAPIYVDDFFHQGRVQRVIMQADSAFRMSPDAISHYYLPSTLATGVTGTGAADRSMIPLSNIVSTEWTMGSPSLTRYNGYAAIQMNGGPAPGRSSGEAMQAMTDIVGSKDFPKGFSSQWSGQSLQEIVAGNQAPLLFALSILAVFLCLAALYESWSIPF
ncbi:MAG: efflux RND transporter permease subunit, partial [Dokdonella sp.]